MCDKFVGCSVCYGCVANFMRVFYSYKRSIKPNVNTHIRWKFKKNCPLDVIRNGQNITFTISSVD